jgi:hypothetical protein
VGKPKSLARMKRHLVVIAFRNSSGSFGKFTAIRVTGVTAFGRDLNSV